MTQSTAIQPFVRSRRPAGRRGHCVIWAACCLTALFGLGALAVDMARVRVAKAELQAATDAAARYAASAMRSVAGNESAAGASASAVFAETKVDGSPVSFSPSNDLTLGIWTPATRTFTPATIAGGANAVRIRTRITMGDSARPFAVASALGHKATVQAESIAMMQGRTTSTYVSAKGNPWLAGMPNGTVSQNLRPDNSVVWDTAGNAPNAKSSPGMMDLATAQMAPGQTLMFDGVTGLAGNGGGSTSADFNADGNTGWIVSLGSSTAGVTTSVNGMSNVKAPINSMIAVFLSDSAPTGGSVPPALDFSSAAARDYTTISPQLKQTFFIGDGRRGTGEAQKIVIPPGATRLFIGNMDAWQWNDNVGGYTATVNSTVSVSTVK